MAFNIDAELEGIADPGGICVSETLIGKYVAALGMA
jgi:hypothetical protein